jgi:arabinogalactan oligomer/maltooligosaccharide transport system substrate-binding protein
VRLPALIALAACGGAPATTPPIHFLHTFAADETELVNQTMAERELAVESSLVPFARGQQVITEIVTTGRGCPDLIRIDATWLPGLAAQGALAPVPSELAELDWLPDAAALVQPTSGPWLALPQTVDGLVVLRDDSAPAPASPSIDDVVAAARAARTPTRRYPLGLRVDGYWLVPWLRGEGAELSGPAGIAGDNAEHALARFAALFGEIAAPPQAAGNEAPDELRRWNKNDVAYWITGPWQLAAMREREHVAASALARAPRGGQLLVVPKCAQRPADGWRLAAELTSVAVELSFARQFGALPSRRAALDAAPQLVHEIHDALAAAEMLPRSPITPLLFDDLNPALAAVVAGDATAHEAIEGVRRGWQRMSGR